MENDFLLEIKDQPSALKRCIASLSSKNSEEIYTNISSSLKNGKFKQVIFTGMGSSYFVSQAAASILASYKITSFAINSAELLHYQYPIIDGRTLLVCISQSGESYEVVELLKKIKSSPVVVGMTNDENSFLAHHCQFCLQCRAGEEKMTSTKSFITTYLAAYVLSLRLAEKSIDWKELSKVHASLDAILNESIDRAGEYVKFLGEANFIQVIARGTDLATASQTALMLMEATKTSSSAMLGAEFRHGPLEVVDKKFISIIYSHSCSETHAQIWHLINDILNFGGKVILITDKKTKVENKNILQIEVECGNPDLFLIPSIIPSQILVNEYAGKKGIVPGNFIHGAKVTKIE